MRYHSMVVRGIPKKYLELGTNERVSCISIGYMRIAWLLRYPARMQVVLGTTNPARVKSAAKAAEVGLTRSEWYALYKAAGNALP